THAKRAAFLFRTVTEGIPSRFDRRSSSRIHGVASSVKEAAMSQPVNRTSPIVAIAAVSVIIFSAVGVGVMTGLIPSSFSKNEPAAAESASAQTEPAAAPAPAPAPVSATASTTPPTAPAKPEAPQAVAAPQPRPAEPVRPAASASAPRVAAVKICAECGTVRAVNLVENPGE